MERKFFLKVMWGNAMQYDLPLDNPQTFNEKIQWIKLNDRKKIYNTMVDKYEAKKYVIDKIGTGYTSETYGVWNRWDDIDFDKLPEKFVLKTTHDSGGYVICLDKNNFDCNTAREKIESHLHCNYYYPYREWVYKDIPPRIIAEEYMENNDREGLHDYKVWCFNGVPKYVQYCSGRKAGMKTYGCFFSLGEGEVKKWDKTNIVYHNEMILHDIPRPKYLDKMIEMSAKLSENTYFLRVDFYILPNDKIIFGELTFYPNGGYGQFDPYKIDEEFGKMLDLSK